MRFENLHDPKTCPAADFGHMSVGEDGLEISWFLEDEQASIEIIERDGKIYACLAGW